MPLPEEKLNQGSFAASQDASHSLPRGAPATAASASSREPVASAAATSSSTASFARRLSSSSGRSRSTSMPWTIFAMPWSGMPGKASLQNPKKSR
jgi:hypothetical protein